MTLGERIMMLRMREKLSQGDMAEKLGVSRQSVSKWETNASVPELDKLILLSDLFHISLDELVRGKVEQEKSQEATVDFEEREDKLFKPKKPDWAVRMVVGVILLGLGLLSCLVSILLSPFLFLAGACLTVYGAVCLCLKKYVALACGWFTWAMFYLYGAFTVGSLRSLLFGVVHVRGPVITSGPVTLAMLINNGMWISLLVLIICTVRAYRKEKQKKMGN